MKCEVRSVKWEDLTRRHEDTKTQRNVKDACIGLDDFVEWVYLRGTNRRSGVQLADSQASS